MVQILKLHGYAVHSVFAMANFTTIGLKQNGTGYIISDSEFVFIVNRRTNNATFLRCLNRRTCKAKAKIQNGQATITDPIHSHGPHDIPALEFRAKVIDAARNPANARASVGEIYTSEFITHQRTHPGAANSVQSLASLASTLKEAKNSYLEKAPSTLAEVDTDYASTLHVNQDGYSFLQACALPNDPERFFMFGNTSYFPRVAHSPTIHIDGTFWTAPGILRQLVTIHGEICGQSFPLCYFLLPLKTELCYSKMWETLKAVLRPHNLDLTRISRVVMDYEAALVSATKIALPHAVVQGCSFHFSQAIYRNVDATAYRNEDGYKRRIRMIIALGHVPSAHKAVALQAVRPFLDQDPRVTQFIDRYFLPNWMNGRDPLLWDFYNVEKRTNNVCESFHSALNRYMKLPHLSFYKFVLVLGEEERMVEKRILNRLAGHPLPAKNVEYERLNAQIRNLHAEFPTRTYEDYLRGLSYCVPDIRQ